MALHLKATLIAIILAVSVCNAAPAKGQTSTSPLANIYACASITDDLIRLECFDAQVSSIKIKEEKKEIIALDTESVEAIERDAFGFNLPSLPKLGILKRNTNKAKKAGMTFKVKSISKGSDGPVITLENGQVWQYVSGDLGYIPKGNVTATIKPASFGSFFIRLENDEGDKGRKGTRVRRIG